MHRTPPVEGQESTDKPSGRVAAVTRVQHVIEELWRDEAPCEFNRVEELSMAYKLKKKAFMDECENRLSSVLSSNQRDELTRWYQEKLGVMTDFSNLLANWLKENEQKQSRVFDQCDKQSSKSSKGTKSSLSTSSSQARVRLAEKRAKIEAEKGNHQIRLAIEEKERRYVNLMKQKKLQFEFEEEEGLRELERQKEEANLRKEERELQLLEKHLNNLEFGKTVMPPNAPSLIPPREDNEDFLNKWFERTKVDHDQNEHKGDKGINNDSYFNQKQSKTNHSLNYNSPKKGDIIKDASLNVKKDWSCVDALPKILHDQNQISLALIRNQESSVLPRHEPYVFDGDDITQFKSFQSAFHSMIEQRCGSNADKFYYLDKYTRGEPQQLVRGCNKGDPGKAFRPAMKLLQEQYGNEFAIAQTYIKKLEMWPVIKSEDGKAMQHLAIFLTSCLNAMEDTNLANQLNSATEIEKIAMKLPFDLRKRYRTLFRKAAMGGYVSFQHLVDFVTEQSREMNMPVMGNIKDASTNSSRREKGGQSSNGRVLYVKGNPASEDETKEKEEDICLACKKDNHKLPACYFFKNKFHEDKMAFLREKAICFACLRQGHRSGACRARLCCSKCNRLHPTSLHQENKNNKDGFKAQSKEPSNKSTPQSESISSAPTSEDKEDTKKVFAAKSKKISFQNGADGSRELSAAVPVKVKLRGSNKFVYTYLGLDGYSSDCFISEKLKQQLEGKGEPTSFYLTTFEKISSKQHSEVIENLEIYSLDEKTWRTIPRVFTHKNWPFTRKDVPRKSDINNLSHLKDLPIDFLDEDIGILAGIKTPEFLRIDEMVCGHPDEVFAAHHIFGWALVGPVIHRTNQITNCYHIKLQEANDIEENFRLLYADNFEGVNDTTEICDSFDDKRWLSIVQSSIKKQKNGHYEIALPFRDPEVRMPCNYRQVWSRLHGLKNKFAKDPLYFEEYKSFMQDMIDRGFMELIPEEQIQGSPGRRWFLTHFAVRHKQKKKLRVVFDCSLKNGGVSLNDKLLQGPDLINNLMGVLLRFRQESIAFMGDIEKMFFQIKVPTLHADFLRILWFPNGNLTDDPKQYRITSHLFGAISSPSCANYALKRTAMENTEKYSLKARESILKSFFVDDWMQSVSSEEEAGSLISEVSSMLHDGGFNLTSFVSSSRVVLKTLSKDKLSKNYKSLDLENSELPQDRALGVRWLVEEDALGYRINVDTASDTRRSLLSTVSSVYDPLGMVGPVVVAGRALFQETCSQKLNWDDRLPQELLTKWRKWLKEVPLLEEFKISRCIKGPIRDTIRSQLHFFSDGSLTAFGTAVYARFLGVDNEIHCSLLLAKAHLTPIGNCSLKTIPRIELNAARLSVQLQQILRREMELEIDEEIFWTDFMTVLRYLNNDSARYQRFVANRVSFIRSYTQPYQWRHIAGTINIADLISRGCNASQLVNDEIWTDGPKFLWQPEGEWPPQPQLTGASIEDLELIRTKDVYINVIQADCVERLLCSSSDWFKLLYRVATFGRLICLARGMVPQKGGFLKTEMIWAENAIWRCIQRKSFAEQLGLLKSSGSLRGGDRLCKLTPFIDEGGLLRVGGRLENSMLDDHSKYPIILPKEHHTVKILARQHHMNSGHMGHHYLLSNLREKYWILGANSLVRDITKNCIGCRKRNARPSEQVMASLPEERAVGGKPPFSHTGTDYFGPFMVTRGRSRALEKRYGVVFTCLTSRCIHLEVANSLDTSSFINALRRFIARRGNIQSLHSDNGTNLVGANRELKQTLDQWNHNKLHSWCQQKHIEWKFNPPCASHYGGIWEREIRSVRKILLALISEQPRKLDDESLLTFICEAEAILNHRPLSPLSSNPEDPSPLTPSHLLLLHPESSPPPGDFDRSDSYGRQRWKHIQYLADVFWQRWRKEYLGLLQERQRWTVPRRSHRVGDLVLVVDAILPRNQWCLGRVTEVRMDVKGNVRAAKVKIARCKSGRDLNISTTEIERPIVKLVLLREAD